MDHLFFGLDTPAGGGDLSLLRSFHDDVSLTMAEQVLRDEGIAFVKKDRGSGAAVRIVTGFSMYGTDLFVAPGDLARASELMAAVFDAEILDEEEKESAQ